MKLASDNPQLAIAQFAFVEPILLATDLTSYNDDIIFKRGANR